MTGTVHKPNWRWLLRYFVTVAILAAMWRFGGPQAAVVPVLAFVLMRDVVTE